MSETDRLAALAYQLEYYFTPENLAKDRFLVAKMDQEGYVPISLVAGFNRVKVCIDLSVNPLTIISQNLTNDFNLVIQVLRSSPRVEVNEAGDRVRAANQYMPRPRPTITLHDIPGDAPKEV